MARGNGVGKCDRGRDYNGKSQQRGTRKAGLQGCSVAFQADERHKGFSLPPFYQVTLTSEYPTFSCLCVIAAVTGTVLKKAWLPVGLYAANKTAECKERQWEIDLKPH